MAIFTDDDRFLKWKYHVEELYLLFPGEEPIELPNIRLVSMMITHDYENNIFPLFRIEVVLEPSRYYKIIQQKENVQFKIRIQKYYREIGKSKESLKRDYINDTFDLILNDSDFDTEKGFKEEQNQNNYTSIVKDDENDLYWTDNRLEFFLFKSDTIKASRKIVNGILSNANVTDSINFIASKAGLNNILMAPADNDTVISELVIPPLTASQAIVFVDSYYGIYKVGSLIYMDLDRNYIMPYDGKCRCWERDEKKETSIVIPKRSSTFSSDLCTVEKSAPDTKINYVVGSNFMIQIENQSITYDVLAGNDIQSIDLYEGEVSTKKSNAITKDQNEEKLIQNMTENPYFNNIYTQQTSARSVVMFISLSDYDASILKPNSIYHVIFEDTALTNKYKGYYQLVRAAHTFIKDGADFALTTAIVLKKMDD